MELNDLEDRLECAIRHINTAMDIDPWAQNLAVESMRMRIALMKGKQPEVIRCRDCKYSNGDIFDRGIWCKLNPSFDPPGEDWFCGSAERRTDDDRNG